MSSDAPLLGLSGITVRRGKSTVLDSVDLVVKNGEIIILTGENGAGKSTLIEAAAGILNLSGGTVKHRGNLVRDSDGRRNRPSPFGLTLQSGGFCQDELVKERIVTAANVAIKISDSKPDDKWVEDELSKWNLRHRADDRIAWLSGGMKRKIGILAGLTPALRATCPCLVLLDEPSTGLDSKSIEILKSEIKNLKNSGHSFVITTHDSELNEIATRTVSVSNKILEKGGKSSESPPGNSAETTPEKTPSAGKIAEHGQKEGNSAENSAEKSSGISSPSSKIVGKGEKSKPSFSPKFGDFSPESRWATRLEKRTRIGTLNRSIPGLIALVVIAGLISQLQRPSEMTWLALLALTPGFISALTKPGFLTHLSDSRAGDWWNALLGERMEVKNPLPNVFEVPLTLTLVSTYLLMGEFTLQSVVVSLSMVALTFGSTMIHALESTLPRQGASITTLLLAILVWPFILTVDLLSIDSVSFAIGNVVTELVVIIAIPLSIYFLIPLIVPE